MKPRGRPHLKQRRTVREENFGVRLAFAIIDFLAIKFGKFYPELPVPSCVEGSRRVGCLKECFEACTLAYALGYGLSIRGLDSGSLPRA